MVANDTALLANCCSIAIVTIDLIDINDHTPEFANATYTLSIEEHSPNGSILGTITVSKSETVVLFNGNFERRFFFYYCFIAEESCFILHQTCFHSFTNKY